MGIKKLIIILLFAGFFINISADGTVNEKISALVDPQNRTTHKKLLDILFQDEDKFLKENGKIDIIKIIRILKENGLLKIFHKEPVNLKAEFEFELNSIFIMKIISDTLNKLGYHYILTSELEKIENFTKWTIEYSSEHVIDPVALSEELLKYNINIETIVKSENFWKYELSANSPSLFESVKISSEDNSTEYTDPRGEFWFNVEDNATLLDFVGDVEGFLKEN